MKASLANDWLNRFGYTLRQQLRWSLPAWKHTVSAAEVQATLPPAGRRRMDALAKQYDLGHWAQFCSLQDWRESLYVLDVLAQYPVQRVPGRGLDIGSKNGCYLPGLATAHRTGWDAVELDAHRRYLWGSTRRVYGEQMAAHFEGCRFWSGDVQEVPGTWAFISWFLPFLFPEPLEAWGLPLRFLSPQKLLAHAVSRLLPGGSMFIVNQGEDEANAQHQLLLEVPGLRVERLGRIESQLGVFSRARFGFCAVKNH